MSSGRNSGGGNRRNRSNNYYGTKNNKLITEERIKESVEKIDENSPAIKQFRMYALELDNKHDRYERIVKLCRDITIESKRIIFFLHTLDKESKRETILEEAKNRLDALSKTLFKNIAIELEGQDHYQYARAYRGGLQEFIEAVTFYQYLKDSNIKDWTEIEKKFIYNITKKNIDNDDDNNDKIIISTLVAPNEYILGIADLTGELMRKCINNLASGDTTSCYDTCNFVRDMYKGFLGCVGISVKEINKKLYTLKQSLIKMENVCYTIKVRGSEIPKHMLADVAIVAGEDYPAEEDEGYQPY